MAAQVSAADSLGLRPRAYCEALVSVANGCHWLAAWYAGYAGSATPIDELSARQKDALTRAAWRLRKRPDVLAYMDELNRRRVSVDDLRDAVRRTLAGPRARVDWEGLADYERVRARIVRDVCAPAIRQAELLDDDTLATIIIDSIRPVAGCLAVRDDDPDCFDILNVILELRCSAGLKAKMLDAVERVLDHLDHIDELVGKIAGSDDEVDVGAHVWWWPWIGETAP